MARQGQGSLIILGTLVAALILAILPLPEWARLYRPQWVTLVMIYWCLTLPHRVSVGTGFLLGILLDVMTGTLLGQQALGLSLIAYISVQTHQRVRIFPLWQLSLTVLILLLLERLLSVWILGVIKSQPPDLNIWITPMIGAFLWPWIYILLRDLRRRFQVT